MEPLFILDGYGVIFRSYFALIRAPRRAPDGRNVSAVFGFFRTLLSLFKDYKPSNFLVALDSKTPTFRDEIFAEYKATRDATPEELKAQFPVIEEAIKALGLPALRVDGYEADDIMATMARKCSEEGRKCFIISSDKDLMQLIDEHVKMLRPSTKEGLVYMNREAVFEDKGVWPEQIVDFLAIVGDTADNVPGVKGIGEKGAAKLLEEFGSLEGIYEALEQGKIAQKGIVQKLEEGRETAALSKRLVILADRIDLPLGPEDVHLRDLDAEAFARIVLPLGMKSLLPDLSLVTGQELGSLIEEFQSSVGILGTSASEAWKPSPAHPSRSSLEVDPGTGKYSGAGASHETKVKAGVVASGAPSSPGSSGRDGRLSDVPGGVDSPEIRKLASDLAKIEKNYSLVIDDASLDACMKELAAAEMIALDTETTGVDAMIADLVGISLCGRAGRAFYLPVQGPEGPVLSEEKTRTALGKLFEGKKLVGQNIKYDMKILRRWGLDIVPAFDTMVAAWLLESSSNKFGMDDLAELYFGYTTIHYEQALKEAGLKKGDSFAMLGLDKALDYAAEDADITFRLALLFEALIRARGMEELCYELEMPLLPILVDMEFEGIGLDVEALEAFSKDLEISLAKIEEEIYELVGRPFNISSPKQLQTILFEERKLKGGKRTKSGGYSTDESVLAELASEDPVPGKILQFRGLQKLKGTYVDALPKLVNPRTGRVHTTFHQHGTATGRMSSKDPNLQNIPIKDEEGRRIRHAFVPAPGKVFVSADYAQIELVVLAHFAGDEALVTAFRQGVDVHRATGSLIFGLAAEEVSPDQRRIAKTINFGVMYGMSAFRLSRELGISRKDADHFIETYFRTYQGITRYLSDSAQRAKEQGGVSTIAGRFRRIPEIYSSNKAEQAGAERIAINTPIQGSAADIVKTAMVKLDARLRKEGLKSKLILQVHDELIFECPEDEVEKVKSILSEVMPNAIKLDLPLKVSIETGKRWGEMH